MNNIILRLVKPKVIIGIYTLGFTNKLTKSLWFHNDSKEGWIEGLAFGILWPINSHYVRWVDIFRDKDKRLIGLESTLEYWKSQDRKYHCFEEEIEETYEAIKDLKKQIIIKNS